MEYKRNVEGPGGIISYKYVPYLFPCVFLKLWNQIPYIFPCVSFFPYGIKSRSRHDRSQSFGSIVHASGLKLTFGSNF